MRRFATLLGATALVALAAACGNTAHVDGAAAPAGLAPSSSPAAAAPATTAPASTAPATKPASEAPSSAPPSSSAPAKPASYTDPDHLTVGKQGVGPLHLGMSRTQAKATGLITLGGSGTCTYGTWKGVSDNHSSNLVFNGTLGVVNIGAWGDQHTAAGISLHSHLSDVKKAYPTWVWDETGDDHKLTPTTGRIHVPLGDGVHFSFSFVNDKMSALQVEHDNHGCYE